MRMRPPYLPGASRVRVLGLSPLPAAESLFLFCSDTLLPALASPLSVFPEEFIIAAMLVLFFSLIILGFSQRKPLYEAKYDDTRIEDAPLE